MGQVKIALVHDFLFTFGGAERVLQSLHQLYPEAPIYTLFTYREVVEQHFPHARIITSSLQNSWFKKWPPLLLASYPRAIESFDFNDFDLVISSSGAFSHGIITNPTTTHICYCHSPMRYVWDYTFRYQDEKGLRKSWKSIFSQPLLHQLRLWDVFSARRVDYWLANSKTVAKRIQKYYQQSATVIYPPVEIPHLDNLEINSNRKYFLSVSRLTPNKKIDLIIQACAHLKLPLHIAGTGTEEQRLKNLAHHLKAEVTFHGQVSEKKKSQLLSQATAFIFAGEDDFGIAPVEALAYGTPVLAYAKGGALETIQNEQNGYLFPEQTIQSLQECIALFQQTGVKLSPEQIRETSLQFSEEVFIQQIKKYVQKFS